MPIVKDKPMFAWKVIIVSSVTAIILAGYWGIPKLLQIVSGWSTPAVTVSPDTVQYSDTTARSRMSLMVNGQDSSVTITTGSYTVTMRAEDMAICMMTEPAPSLISPDSLSMTIEPGHPWYPKPGDRTVYIARCAGLDGSTQYDTVTVSR